MKKFVCLVTALAVIGCAGRAPQQIQVVQIKDQTMDCTAINAEIAGDTAHIADLQKEESSKRTQNVLAGIAGTLLVWPAYFLMDFQDAAGHERQALESRDQYLAALAVQRCGPGYHPPVVMTSTPNAAEQATNLYAPR